MGLVEVDMAVMAVLVVGVVQFVAGDTLKGATARMEVGEDQM